MRKLLVNLIGILTFSSSALPLVGCTFNASVNQITKKIAANLATQTSNVIKSLVVSKNLNADTQATINDSLNPTTKFEPIINNYTQNTTVNNWNQFQDNWGLNKNINIKGFKENDFIVANNHGSLTKEINNLNNTNQTLEYLNYVSSLNIIDNSTLYGILLGKNAIAKPIVKSFLTDLKNDNLTEPWSSLIKNLINNYQGNVLEPITQLLTELVDGWKQVTTPDEFEDFFLNWKDNTGMPYSEWVNANGTWKFNAFNNWNKNDINLYRGGTIINHLFKQMALENSDKITNPQYIGAIISANLDNPTAELLAAFQPYLDLLLTNPKYLLQLITGLIPLVKDLIFNVSDLTTGINHLTLGDSLPTNSQKNSYNLKTIFANLKTIINDKTKVETWANKLLASPFLYDIKISVSFANNLISVPLPVGLTIKTDTKTELLTAIINLLTSSDFSNTFNKIYNIIENLNDQFHSANGIDLNLENLKNLLINKNNGLLVLLANVTDAIANIIKPDNNDPDQNTNNLANKITDEQLTTLYESLGGQKPINNITNSSFKKNSILWTLQTELANRESDLSTIFKVIYRNDEYQGVANIIIKQNENWITENYTNYLSPNYSKSKIININYNENETNTDKITNINYEFLYQIGTNNYHFFIKGVAIDPKNSFYGTHHFKFTDIYKI